MERASSPERQGIAEAPRRALGAAQAWSGGHRYALLHSVRIALVVGPTLVLANNFDHVLKLSLPRHFWPKALATLLVPFFVSLYSALRYACRRP